MNSKWPPTYLNFALGIVSPERTDISVPGVQQTITQRKHYQNRRSSSLNRSQTPQLSSALIASELRSTTTEIHAQEDDAQRASILEK